MRPLPLLNALLSARRPIPRGDALERYGAAVVDALEAAGFAVRGPSLSMTLCRLCDEIHATEVLEAADGGLTYQCVGTGLTGKPHTDDLATLDPNAAAFVAALREAMGSWRGDFPPREKLAGRLWKLGESQIAGGPIWTCFLALRGLDREILDTVAADQGSPGLLLAWSPPPLSRVGQHGIVQLEDVIAIMGSGRLSIDRVAIASALGVRSHSNRNTGRTAKGLKDAREKVSMLSDEQLHLPPLERLDALRQLGVGFARWPKGQPPKSLLEAVNARADQEIARRFPPPRPSP